MEVIREIKITHFRSFSQTVHIKDLKDLNVISGKNDSGKSNILKALNLFFSEEYTDFFNEFDFSIDFSKDRLERSKQGKQKQTIKIAILFNRMGFSDKVLPNTFWVEKEWDRYGYLIARKTKQSRGAVLSGKTIESSTTLFLNKIHFMYIPAIKDADFFSYLKTEYQKSISEKLVTEVAVGTINGTHFNDLANILSVKHITELLGSKIDIEAKRMMEHFLGNAHEVSTSNFKIPNIDFSKVLEVITENDIPLTSRGDGVQAKFIPQILNEISRNIRANTVIWGFEEPENSYEYSNAQLLAERFRDEYAIDKQIILTSHAFNFITLKGDNISLFRAWKTSFEEGTQVACLNGNTNPFLSINEELAEELGIINLNTQLEEAYQRTMQELEKIELLQEKLKQYEKPVLYVEDKYDQIYKISWLKLNDFDCSKHDFDEKFESNAPFAILRAEGAGNLQGFLQAKNIDHWANKKVVGLFDFDDAGVNAFKSTKNHGNWKGNGKNEKQGNLASGYYSKRKNCNFYAMLMPIPENLQKFTDYKNLNLMEIENLLPDTFLLDNKFAIQENILGHDYLKIKDGEKPKLWEKTFDLSKDDFVNFQPIFSKLKEFFDL